MRVGWIAELLQMRNVRSHCINYPFIFDISDVKLLASTLNDLVDFGVMYM